jgi:ribulose-phosphate 3-epimerase|tara:strand:+ start:2318 stop:2908 length:591 start_codon:yes stop_codon:yes gene_type:complete
MNISASIQAANQLNLLTDIKNNSDKFDQLHIDITDGHFTNNIGLSLDIVSLLKNQTDYKLDVHLMLENNSKYVEKVIDYGADIVTVHCESTDIDEFKSITNNYDNIGIGILPSTNMEVLKSYADFTSIFLLLTVNPGFSNQHKAVNLVDRVNEFNKVITEKSTTLIIDGGVTAEDLQSLEDNGVDIAVQGGAIFGK